jgi:hypothetical protein
MCLAKPFFWSFCSLICKELAIIYSFLIGSNNSWSFVLCDNLATLRILTNVTNVTPNEVFCSRFSTRFDKIFLPENYFNLFRRFWPLLPLKVHFHDFCFVFGPFLRIPPTFSSILKVRTEGSFRLKLIVRFW